MPTPVIISGAAPSMASYKLPDHCTPTSLYLIRLSSAFGSCIPTSFAFLSTLLGLLSIVSWLFAQVPQIYKNYQLKSASGLSIYFLAEWLLGDLTNLLGALLTKQATWQIVVAMYYVTVDVGLCYQYFWYTHVKPWRKTRLVSYKGNDDGDENGSGDILVGISPSDDSSVVECTKIGNGRDAIKALDIPAKIPDVHRTQASSPSSSKEKSTPLSNRSITRVKQSPLPIMSPKALLIVSMLCVVLTNASPINTQHTKPSPSVSSSEVVGRILSWTSTLLYLGSRLPQIYKNAIRRSTSGLSPTLFIAAFCGNFFYSTSLISNPLAWESYSPYGLHGWVGSEGSERTTWVALAAPFFLGAAGVLVMDATIGVQFLMYGEGLEKSVVLVEDREGRSSWRGVSGWMRGWVPSSSPEARGEEEAVDDTRPLLGRQEGNESGYGAT